VASPSGKKYHFTVLLEVSLHPFSVGVARISSGGAILSTMKLFFFSSFLSSIENYKLVLFDVDILTSAIL
jgi:hypothetical protein